MLLLTKPVAIISRLCLVAFLFISCEVQCHSFKDEKRLYTFITEEAEPGIRPVLDQTRSINISVLPALIELKELNAKDQTLKTSMALFLWWKQDLLRWNESDFGGADKITLNSRQVWTPDIIFHNRIDYGQTLSNDADKSFKVTLFADGRVVWIIGGQLETSCTVDVSWYPFDNQTCIVEISKMSLSDREMQLIPAEEFVLTEAVGSNSEWTIHDSPIYRNDHHADKSYLEVHIVLTRKPLSYIINTIIPVFILSFMNVLSFKIPLQSGERISYSVSLFLSFMVLLTMISDSIPNVSSQVSMLQLFVTLQLAFGAVVTSLSIALVKVSFAEKDNKKSSKGCLKELCTMKSKTCDCNESEEERNRKRNDGAQGMILGLSR
ncbi:ACHA-like protein [Mya arenaria]|uniref:ACHA-like protein n=1 Tax=Mya arenaria TaxID=6604 RepID=A0ABY7G6T5_MYAAR|nr:ACHA-like protein [Mya arenaria]